MRFGSLLHTFAFSLAVSSTAWAKLLIDFRGGQDPSELGPIELERHSLGDHVSPAEAGDNVYIRNDEDKALGRPALHFHRSPHFRRAELRFLDREIEEGRTYYIGYQFRLSNSRPGLVIFQHKKLDKYAAPTQNIPFHLEFKGHDELTLDYTTPNSGTEPGAGRKPYWHGKFSTGDSEENIHSVAFAMNTDNNGKGWLEFYLDGVKQKFDNGKDRLENIYLRTGIAFPKVGLYRGEAAVGDERDPGGHTFDSYVYRVQVSDSSLDEIAESAGLKKDKGEPQQDPEKEPEQEPEQEPEPSDEPQSPSESPEEPTEPSSRPPTCKTNKSSRHRRHRHHRRHHKRHHRRHHRHHRRLHYEESL